MKIHQIPGDVTVYEGDWIKALCAMPSEIANCCTTSPPYYNLRDYNHEGQLGMEKTPEEYIEKLVVGMREVRRVLRNDGTLWLNIGDSYAGSTCGTQGKNGAFSKRRPDAQNCRVKNRASETPGIKSKDLIGIPWALAKALRDPYYAGRIKSERDRAWLAAIMDGEGSICGFHHIRKDGGGERTGVQITITNSSTLLLDEAERIWSASRSIHQKNGEGHLGSREIYRWIVHSIENKILFLREIYPYLIAKKKQALVAYNILLFMRDAKRLGQTSQKDAVRNVRFGLTELLSQLNKGLNPVLPAWLAEPESVLEQGWYLRQDIIWHKPNPMPESVQDRCTKAHEYVFLLTKSSRYYYDCDAIAEAAIGGLAGNHNHKGTTAYNDGQTEHRTKAGLLNYAQRQRENVRPQMEAALRKGREGGLTEEHYAAIRAAGMTDSGKAQATQSGFGKNTVRILELAAEAKHVLGGYYREFLSGEKRNKRSVWTIPSAPYADAHFATFPPKLVEPCILAGCPVGGVVLDPFGGSGTTAEVARAFGRKTILCELNPDYIELIKKRLDSTQTRLTDYIEAETKNESKEIPLFS